jgi:DNA-binding MarR family transcriptional regulator
MGIFNKVSKMLTHKRKTYKLTEVGKRKHDQYATTEPKLSILSHLDSTGESSVKEIAEAENLDEEKVNAALRDMEDEGWVECK